MGYQSYNTRRYGGFFENLTDSQKRNGGILGLVAIALTSLCGGWILSTHQDRGHVEELHWRSEVYRDNWQLVTREGWRDDLSLRRTNFPTNGRGEFPGVDNIRNCHSEVHHMRSYACGRSCTGSGSHRHCHTRMCSTPVYRDKCSYDTWDWVVVETQVDVGRGIETRWPEVACGTLDRERKIGTYDAEIEYAEETGYFAGRYRYINPIPDERTYKTWSVGERVTVIVRNGGWVSEIHRHQYDASNSKVE